MKNFGNQARRRQETFRNSSTTLTEAARSPADGIGKRNGHLLALGCEEQNLYPALRGSEGASAFLAARNIHWWRSSRSGDDTTANGPTRNMASSQIACINFLLPLAQNLDALQAILQSIDNDVSKMLMLAYTPHESSTKVSSPVEIEWVGAKTCLEGGRGTRGANTTSVDALMVGQTEQGVRRAYLFEWKYVEEYIGAKFLGADKSGETRRRRYAHLYSSPHSRFNGQVPMDEMFYEPFYQIMRLGLLADKMVRDREFGVDEAKVVVVCPDDNVAYRETITSRALESSFPDAKTVEEVVQASLRQPSDFAVISPECLVNAVRHSAVKDSEAGWLAYQHERYGY